jgi:hypothetical protein
VYEYEKGDLPVATILPVLDKELATLAQRDRDCSTMTPLTRASFLITREERLHISFLSSKPEAAAV